ncbi:hypothetical protein D3C84_843300 [compost metagenome]
MVSMRPPPNAVLTMASLVVALALLHCFSSISTAFFAWFSSRPVSRKSIRFDDCGMCNSMARPASLGRPSSLRTLAMYVRDPCHDLISEVPTFLPVASL